MSLSQDEVKQIGSYFARHYREGRRVKVPDNFSDDPLGWLRKQPMFKINEFPLDSNRYSPDGNKPRILLRERDSFTDFIEKLKQSEESSINLSLDDFGKYSEPDLSEGHFEWKTWLQYMVELSANGQGSIKLLASQDGGRDSERREAFNKRDHLSDHFLSILEKNLIKYHKVKAVYHIEILEKINDYRQKTEGNRIWQTDSDDTSPSGRLIWSKICNALVSSIISLAKFNPPPPEYQDDFEKSDFIEISISANKFLSELSNSVSNILLNEMDDASKIKNRIESDIWEKIGLSDKELIQFEEMINKGFGYNNTDVQGAEKMTHHHSLKLSYHILIFLIWEGLLETKTMAWKDYLRHYSNPNKREEVKRPDKKRSYPHMLVFTDKFKQLIGNCTLGDYKNNYLHPIFGWLTRRPDRYMYCPPMAPAQKDGNWEGGLCKPRGSIISSHYNYEEFKTPRCYPREEAVESIKLLQTTQWEINLDFLSAVFDFIPIKNSEPIVDIKSKKQWIDQIIPKKEVNNAIFHELKEDSGNDIIEKNKQRKRTLSHVERIIEHNANVFWHAWTFDFRGRMYPRSRNLSPQGDDLDKALIRFKQWKYIGVRGIFWLHVHVHNLFEGVENPGWHIVEGMDDIKGVAQKRQKFQNRDEWVNNNLEELRRIARNPLEKDNVLILELNSYRGGGSESFQRLAAVIELDRVWSEYETTKDWGKVKSGLPIHLDASTNGYQHLAALFRDKELAKAVNVTEVDSPNDLYKRVSEKAKEIFIEGNFSFTTTKNKLKYEKILGDFSDSEKKFLEETLFTRNFAKQPTMRLAYGGQRLENCYDGKNSSGNPRWEKIKKSQEELSKDQTKRNNIPDNVKENYTKFENLDTWYRVPNWKWSWFSNTCSSDAKAKEIQSLLREWKWIRCWSNESLLYKSFKKNESKLPDSLTEWEVEDRSKFENNITQQKQLIFQNHVTQLCDIIYKHAVRDVTQKANSKLTNQFKKLFKAEKWNDFTGKITTWKIANKGWNDPEHESYMEDLDSLDQIMKMGKADESRRTRIMSTVRTLFKDIPTSPFRTGKSEILYMHANVIKWDLPDKFRVKNYYIKYRDESLTDSLKPTKRGSIYAPIQPNWLKRKTPRNRKKPRNRAIFDRLEELLEDEEFNKMSEKYELFENLKQKNRKRFIPSVEQMLSEIDENEEKIKFDEIRKVIKVKDHNINQYSLIEMERINPTKVESSIAPNFIHSLDSYHMREIIRRMGSNCDELDFWAVHDSFGIHASEIDKLREIVKSSFYELYKQYDVNSLGDEISTHWSNVLLGDFDPEKILKSEYMIS